MYFKLNEKVDVVSIYNKLGTGNVLYKQSLNGFRPYKIRWRNREYKIVKLGYHHKIKVGSIIHHIFSVASASLAFRLDFDTEILSWTLEEVSDGFGN